MFNVFEAAHGCADPVSEFLRPLETTRHLRHILVDLHLAPVGLLRHVSVVDLLGHVEFRIHHGDDFGVVAVKVLLDEWSLQ